MVLSMDRWIGKVAVITGAGGGVGGSIAAKLVETGLQVVGIDARPENLETLSTKLQNEKGKLHPFTVDITEEDAVVNLFKKVSQDIGPVHILINCAAIIQQTNLIDGDVKKWKKLLDTNVIGLSIMTKEAINVMRGNNIDGHIVHICSVAGHAVPNIPGLNMYPASKHAVRALTETLRLELNRNKLKIKITCISPGAIDSSMGANNGFRSNTEVTRKSQFLNVADVADAIWYALSTPPHVQVHELMVRPVGELY